MAFPPDLLNNNEELVLDLRPHWVFLVPSGAATLGALIVSVLAKAKVNNDVLTYVTLGAFVVALAWFGWTYLKWNTTMFVLTSDRILTRRGVLSKRGIEIPLDRVNTVFFEQSVLDRIVGAGDIAIESAGERGSETFEDIRRPSIVQKEIYVQMEANENRKFDRGRDGAHPDATTPQPESITDQIAKLSELHQRGVLSDAEFARKKTELLDRM